MLTVMDADAARRAFETRVLTPAKARALEEHIESQLANPSMGFDVDVLLLLHQKVTGFEADCDDALELREMIQRAVRKKTEEAYAYAVSTGKKKPSRRASNGGGGARMVSPTTAADGDDTDLDGNDDDGVSLGGPLIQGQTTSVTIDASADGFIDAWIDLNGDGLIQKNEMRRPARELEW